MRFNRDNEIRNLFFSIFDVAERETKSEKALRLQTWLVT